MSSSILQWLSKKCFILGVVFGFLAFFLSQLEGLQKYALPVGSVGGSMFVLWLVLGYASMWRERSKEESMEHVLQDLEERGEAPLTEFMESIFAKRRISYDTQKGYFAVFERVGLIEIVDGRIRSKKREQKSQNSTA
jgi:hypothetical protein